jgi:GntR family transcriptional regulator
MSDLRPVSPPATLSFSEIIGPLDKQRGAPLYMQVQRSLRDAIQGQVLRTDDVIPPERDLAVELNVSRITVRNAIEGLVAEGLLTRKRGAGTFVAARVEKNFSRLTSFSEDMAARGRKPHSQWLSKNEGIVTPEEALSFGLSPGTRVYRFQRLRYADGLIMALEHSTVPAHCLPSLDAVDASLYDALEKTGHRPVRALQRLRALAFETEQAEWLGVEPGAPGLFIERRGFGSDGRTCELTQSWYRGDAYDVVAELNDVR